MKLIKLTRYDGRTVYLDPNTVSMISELRPIKGTENLAKSRIKVGLRMDTDVVDVLETADEVARMVQESTETREKPNTKDTDNFATTDMETFRQGMAAIASKFL